MSDCDRFRDLLIERLYGELSTADRETLELHLAICEDCEAAAADYALIHQAADELPDPAPRAATVELLMQAARDEAAEARKVVPLFGIKRKVLAPAMAAAAVLVLAFGAVVLYDRFGGEEPGASPDARTVAAPSGDQARSEATPAIRTKAGPPSKAEARLAAGEAKAAGEGAAPEAFAPAPTIEVGDLHEREPASAGGAGRTWKKSPRSQKAKRDVRRHRGRAGRKKAEKARRDRAKDAERERAQEETKRREREAARATRRGGAGALGSRAGGEAAGADRPARRYAEPPPPRTEPEAAAAKPAPAPAPPLAPSDSYADDDLDAAPMTGAAASMGDAEEAESMALADEAPRKKSRSSYRRRRHSEAAPAEAAPAAEQARAPRAADKSDAISAGVLLSRARERKAAGDCRGALVSYNDLMLQFPGYRRMDLVWLEAAECYKRLGQKRKALELLDRLDKRYPAQIDRSRRMREEFK